MPVAGAPRRARHTAAAAVPRGLPAGRGRDGLLLGRRARVLAGAGRVHDRRRLRRRLSRRTPPTRRSAAAAPATPRPCWSSSTPPKTSLRGDAPAVLGEPRPDPGHAPGQRRRHPVPLGDLLVADEAQREAAVASRDAYNAKLTRRRLPEITTEIAEAGPFYYAEDYHQQYLHKNPWGYCGLGGTGVSCPVGLGAAQQA